MKTKKNNRPNIWGMIENIFVASLSTGQLIWGCSFLLLFLLILKLPNDTISSFFSLFFEKLANLHYIAWISLFVVIFMWRRNYILLKRSYQEKIDSQASQNKELIEIINSLKNKK